MLCQKKRHLHNSNWHYYTGFNARAQSPATVILLVVEREGTEASAPLVLLAGGRGRGTGASVPLQRTGFL